MTPGRATSLATFLVAAALAVSACGGDDEGGGDSARTGADPPLTTTGETGTTQEGNGTTTRERTGTTTRERERERERERNRNKGGGSDGSSGSGGGNSGSSQGQQLTGKNVERTSKTVCSNFLPTQLAKDLEDGDKSAEDIAKDYSAGYPSSQRKQAYDGCLAGLKAR